MNSSGSWGEPYHSLLQGIQKLRDFADHEKDETRRADLDSKIKELELRAQNYFDVMTKPEGENNG